MKIIRILFLTIFILLSTNRLYSQWGIPTVLVAGRVMKDIIEDFERAGGRLMQDAQGTGNALIARFCLSGVFANVISCAFTDVFAKPRC